MIKINQQTTLNHVISVYFPNGLKGDNTDWLKDIALSNKSYVMVGDFNARAPFGENGCTSVIDILKKNFKKKVSQLYVY